ncbi:ArnT family glycosyltransferase [Thermocrinis minervae]|uniref:4-amino-4-deoxy-L-arabinose transferase n=1 Tax=Thermocrinis minervae TaxID=381751 RepID=A0A1M6S7R0_9AQUI|nr:glycosyltransferase family 39 protein [Thermocrinis minervae]SHK40824.1 4-amino-4-deoxy-L-arabinose transferase [Thermocrinis minervae]
MGVLIYSALLISILVYFIGLFPFQVWSPNEAFYADASRRMLETGDYITPYYNGELRLEKPPLTYWFVVLGYKLFGVNEVGLRFMHTVLGLLLALVVFLLARLTGQSTRASTLAAIIILLSVPFFVNSHYASPEVPFSFFISLSLLLWQAYYRYKKFVFLLFAFLSSSLAMWVKGPAGFLLPAAVVSLYLLFTDPKELLKARYYILTVLSLAVGLWWHVYQLATHREAFLKVFFEENLKRVYSGGDPWYFYLVDTLASFLPYSFIFYLSLVWVLLRKRRELYFFFAWSLVILFIFSLVKQKIPVYTMPAYPAMAILTASFLDGQEWNRIKVWSSLAISSLLMLVSTFGVFYLSLPSYLLLFVVSAFLVSLKVPKLAPIYSILSFYLILLFGVLPWLEAYRPYKEVGEILKAQRASVYSVGHFLHSLPFYAGKEVNRRESPRPGSLVVFQWGTFSCKPIYTFRAYTGSESRLLKYILDVKRGKNFSDFGVCVAP